MPALTPPLVGSQGSVEVQSTLVFGHGNGTVTSDAVEQQLRNSLDRNGFVMDLQLASIQSEQGWGARAGGARGLLGERCPSWLGQEAPGRWDRRGALGQQSRCSFPVPAPVAGNTGRTSWTLRSRVPSCPVLEVSGLLVPASPVALPSSAGTALVLFQVLQR